MAITARALGAALVTAATVAAHGHVANIVVNGVYYEGYGADSFPYMSNPPTVLGWTANQPDNGFVSPDAFGGPDIICHKSGTPGGGHVSVKAGDSISLQWNTWPDSHHGPVLDYLANCNGPCETVDKTTLKFFKIDGPAYISGANPGFWATDVLIQNNFTWLVQIPANIAPGNYVLRHEIIALHAAGSANGAQAYPQCLNLQITGSGTYAPAGVAGTALYKATDPGILYNLYTDVESYTVPGPAIISGVPVSVAQVSSKATATATATPASGGGGSGSGPSSTTKATATATLTTVTTTTSPPSGGAGQTLWGQCGGSGWTGPTSCAQGHCTTLNPYYNQCVN
jgi:cellulase